jgi:hypothetical protein
MAIYIPEPEVTQSPSMLIAQQVQDALKNIEAWPHWNLVQQVAMREYNLTADEIATLLPEYQRFLALIAARPAGGIGMYSSEVDKIWHSHLLLTRKYRSFCQEIYGRFIDHEPNLSSVQLPKSQCTAPPTPPACIPDTPKPGQCGVACEYKSHSKHDVIHINEEDTKDDPPSPKCFPDIPPLCVPKNTSSSKCVASNSAQSRIHINDTCAVPQCKPGPEPAPKCSPACTSGRSHTKHDFVELYKAAFGHNPPKVWNVKNADADAVTA